VRAAGKLSVEEIRKGIAEYETEAKKAETTVLYQDGEPVIL
jgi:hypothetical protein